MRGWHHLRQSWIGLGLLLIGSTTQAAWHPLGEQETRLLSLKPDIEQGHQSYDKWCSECHALEAWGSSDGDYPQLAGQHREVIIKQFLDIREGRRQNPAMQAVTKSGVIGDQELINITAYIGTLPMSAENGRGNGHLVVRGERIYYQACTVCHGEKGEGNGQYAYPRLQAQHHNYLLRQLKNIQSGQRDSHKNMVSLLKQLQEKDLYALADFISRQPPADENAGQHYIDSILSQFQTVDQQPETLSWQPGGKKEEAILAITPDLRSGKILYEATCAVCHGLRGWGVTSGEYPQLAGQHQSLLVKQLLDMQNGRRANPLMENALKVLKATGDQGLANVTAYIDSLKMSPNNSTGSGEQLAMGEKLYQSNCASCHGKEGEGKAEFYYPRLQAQHYNYLLRQLHNVKSNRRLAPPSMTSLVNQLSDAELSAVLDYTSRLAPAADKNVIDSPTLDILNQIEAFERHLKSNQ